MTKQWLAQNLLGAARELSFLHRARRGHPGFMYGMSAGNQVFTDLEMRVRAISRPVSTALDFT